MNCTWTAVKVDIFTVHLFLCIFTLNSFGAKIRACEYRPILYICASMEEGQKSRNIQAIEFAKLKSG